MPPADLRPLTVSLRGAGLDPGQVGGKSAALDRVIGLDLMTPASAAVTTESYRRFIDESDLGALLDRLRGESTRPERRWLTDTAVDDAFLATAMPTQVDQAIQRCLARIDARGPWAVRSSATAEDLEEASFAGQYRSLLDVATDDVTDSIRLVWASLWHRAPRRYRWFRGIDDTDISMGVLLMQMLQPSHAGVLFTSDPMGARETARIEVVEGLGEGLVSGDITPDVVLVDRTRPTGDLDTYPFLTELLAAGAAIEAATRRPQDIEWAVERGRLFVLQARPITRSAGGETALDDGFDDPPIEGATLTTAGIAEMLPGHLAPRTWSLNRPLVDEGFRRLFATLGADATELTDPGTRLVVRCHGRSALNLDVMKAAADSIPGGSGAELEQQYLGAATNPEVSARSRGRATELRQGARTLRARSAAALESEVVIRIVDGLLDQEPELTPFEDDELLRLRGRLGHLAGRVVAAEIAIAAVATASFGSVEQFLSRHLDDPDVSGLTQALTTGAGSGADGELVGALEELALRLATTPELRPAVGELDWTTAQARLGETRQGRRYLDDFRARLRHSGSMAVCGGPTWEAAPDLAWLMLTHQRRDRSAARQRRAEVREEVEHRLTEDPGWRSARALRGHIVDVKKHFLRREVSEAAAFLDRREQTKAALLRLGGVIHRVDREIGRRLVSAGRLEDVADIDLLANHEPANLLRGTGPAPAEIAMRRRQAQQAVLAKPLPLVFRGRPSSQPVRPTDGDRTVGWAASPGHHQGPARVVYDPKSHGLRRGDVLVASNTDASWAPLFLIAGAIVVEQGGPLSHAAIVARELGLPAVVNVPGIVERIASEPDRIIIDVDGSTGDLVLREAKTQAPPTMPGPAGVVPTRSPPAITETTSGRSVFITGLIGAGAAMSALFALTEAVSGKRAQRRFDRRAEPLAKMNVVGVLHGFDAAARSPAGLSDRRYYWWAAAAITLIAGVFAAESTESYLETAAGNASTIWWALALVSCVQLGVLAAVAGVSAWRWPDVVPVTRRLTRAYHGSQRTTRHRTDAAAIGALALFGGFVLLLAINLWTPSLLTGLDERLLDAIAASPDNDRIGPVWLRWFGQPRVVIPLALAIGLATFRCRVLALLFPLLIVGAGLLNVTLWWIVGKERPDLGIHAGRSDSFPGGHAITVTLLFGMLPLAAYVVSHRRWLLHLVRLPALVVTVILLVDQIRQGGHWPTDQIAGVLLGLSGVIAAHGLVGSQAAHYRCRSCPWVDSRHEKLPS